MIKNLNEKEKLALRACNLLAGYVRASEGCTLPAVAKNRTEHGTVVSDKGTL